MGKEMCPYNDLKSYYMEFLNEIIIRKFSISDLIENPVLKNWCMGEMSVYFIRFVILKEKWFNAGTIKHKSFLSKSTFQKLKKK